MGHPCFATTALTGWRGGPVLGVLSKLSAIWGQPRRSGGGVDQGLQLLATQNHFHRRNLIPRVERWTIYFNLNQREKKGEEGKVVAMNSTWSEARNLVHPSTRLGTPDYPSSPTAPTWNTFYPYGLCPAPFRPQDASEDHSATSRRSPLRSAHSPSTTRRCGLYR